jgi:hypothetical protein
LKRGMSVFERIFIEEQKHWKRLLHVETDNDPALVSLHRAASQITMVQGATSADAAALIEADPEPYRRGRSRAMSGRFRRPRR